MTGAFGTALRSAQERQTFISVPFPSISTHFGRELGGFALIVAWIPAFAGMTGSVWYDPQECVGVAKL